ncbi:MAG: hypothetical protein JWQ25_2120 [Daejeonella sp.]|nr:hypothetical protein [Daejeonella sp.]
MRDLKNFKNYNGDPYNDMSVSLEKWEQWGIIRHCYNTQMYELISTAKQNISSWIDINFLDWDKHFSPIEKIVWSSIRSTPHLVMYPQFPLFNYFIDFANPFLKIGLELDGKDFHNQIDDEMRDKMFLKYGWKIYRASGKLSNSDKEDYEIFEDLDEFDFEDPVFYKHYEDWMTSTISGLLSAISIYYFKKPHNSAIRRIVLLTLENNSLTGSERLTSSQFNEPF